MPKNNTITLANPDQPDAQAAMNAYRPSGTDDAPMGLAVGTSACTVYVLTIQGSIEPTSPAGILLYGLFGATVLVWALSKGRSYRRRRAYDRHVNAGNIITVDNYLFQAWDELCEEHDVRLSSAERQAEVRKLFTAATELHDELQQHAEAGDDPGLAEMRLLAEARIRARLAHEVDTLRAVQEAQRQIARLPAADIDIVTPEEVEAQLRTLRARRDADVETNGED